MALVAVGPLAVRSASLENASLAFSALRAQGCLMAPMAGFVAVLYRWMNSSAGRIPRARKRAASNR